MTTESRFPIHTRVIQTVTREYGIVVGYGHIPSNAATGNSTAVVLVEPDEDAAPSDAGPLVTQAWGVDGVTIAPSPAGGLLASELHPDRYEAISHNVRAYFDSTGMAEDFDIDAIIAKVASRVNALSDLTEAEFNDILQQHERSS